MNIFCCPKKIFGINSVVLLLLIITIYIIIFKKNSESHKLPVECPLQNVDPAVLLNLPVVRIYGIQESENKLDVVKNIFHSIGYRVTFENDSRWDVLWSHTYPFYSLRREILSLEPHQKVNHFPGSGYLTQKNNLAMLPVPGIPKSFVLPANKEAFLKFAEDNRNIFWIIKNSNHRGIKIFSGTENLDMDGTFIQEFIKDPLLINGKKFDIGVYVVLTSIDPLRVYMYSGDILLRFCKQNYFPLDVNAVDTYVVGDDYLPVWEVPDLKHYFLDLNYTAKESLNAYIRSKGKSSKELWHQISKVIQDVYFNVEKNLLKSALPLGNIRNFFELVRFDFIADEYLNVYLLEVNMSPNLSPAHFPQNRLLYEQIVFGTLQIVGFVRKFQHFYNGEAELSEKDIQVNSEQCGSHVCENSCKSDKCKICNQCLDGELRNVFKTAYLEFLNKGKFTRLIPVPSSIKGTANKGSKSPVDLSQMNKHMDSWFKGKCLQDSSWCQ